LIRCRRRRLGGGIAADPAFEQRVQRGAEIGPENESKGGMRRHHSLGRESHDQQYDGDARMGRPGESGGNQHIDRRLGRDPAEQHP